jgi:hypothetical protein
MLTGQSTHLDILFDFLRRLTPLPILRRHLCVCYSGVAVVLHVCCIGVTVVLQWRYSDVTVVLQWCYSGVKGV